MAYDELTFGEVFQAAALSFDADLLEFPFARTVPIAIYADAGEQSSDLAEELWAWLEPELEKVGFSEIRHVGTYYGSLLQLNLCNAPSFEDGHQVGKRLRELRQRVAGFLEGDFGKKVKHVAESGNLAVKIVVGLGTVVLIVHALPAAPLVVGGLVIPGTLWAALGIAKESGDVVEAAGKLLTRGDDGGKRPVAYEDPVMPASAVEGRFREMEEKMRKQEEMIRKQEREIRELRRRSGG